jgi:glutamate synthase domain-containing protein 3
LRFTGSTLALSMIDDWDNARGKFVKVFPHEYRRAMTEMAARAGRPATQKQRAAA